MLIAVHGAVGALIGENINSPILAFVLAFVSHFCLDFIPHGDHDQVKYYKKEKRLNKIVSLVLVDASICIFFLANYFSEARGITTNFRPVIAGIAGGILPDIIVAFYNLHRGYFFRFNYFHHRVHQFVRIEIPFTVAFIYQMILLVIIWTLYKF